DLGHPAADLVIAGLVSASELDAGRLVPLLTRLASSIRDEAHMRVRIEVSRARVRTSMKIVGFFVGLTMLLMIVVGRELLRGYESAAGQVWLLIVGTVVVLAIWITRKLAEIPQPERFVARRPSS
ncbi:MAG: tight adherence protein B, partial [Acidimicrobiales bacterium]